MFTDIVGYTALSQRDESQALRLLRRHQEIVRPIFARYGGHEIKTIGDAFLVEFDSALDATECGVEVQKVLRNHNARATRKIHVRIGIHIGDVIHQKGDVFGDAVNIASRIEPLAEAGEVCISEQVYDQVRNKIPYQLIKLDSQNLKNITFPIDVYKVQMPWEEKGRSTGGSQDGDSISLIKRFPAVEGIGTQDAMRRLVLKLTLKNKIAVVALMNEPFIPRALAKFSAEVDYSRGETLHMVSGIETVKVVTDTKNLPKLQAVIPRKKIISITTDLAEIVISLSEIVIQTPGVTAVISSHLARNGINLIEYITCSPHAIVVVEEKDALRSYKLLEELATGRKEIEV